MSCINKTARRIIVFEENKRKAEFRNSSNKDFEEGEIDGCLIKDGRKRCDAFLRSSEAIWLIELKGGDVEKAVDQIVATSQHLKSEIGEREIIPVIVATRCPAISGQQKRLARLKNIAGKFENRVILRSRVAKIPV